jgi:hemolysin D
VGSHLDADSHRDIGFVHEGQEAAIKIETFNFTRYGLLHGKVLSLSQDSLTQPQRADPSGGAPPSQSSDSSEPGGPELIYTARISLEQTALQVEDKMLPLSPGMAVTVEVKTGARRVIEYLLSPLMRYGHDAMHER